MWRASLYFGFLVFALGALSSLALTVIHTSEGDFDTAAALAFATAFFSWGAFAIRRDLQRLRQQRESQGPRS